MPTIIKVHEVDEDENRVNLMYVNADHILAFYMVSDTGKTFIDVNPVLMRTQESPDEIAALIHDAARGYDIEFRPGSDPSEGPEADIPPMRYGR